MIEVPGCRVLVQPLKIEDHDPLLRRAKALGIRLSDMDERKAQQTVDRGTVLQIGPKASDDYLQGVKVGSLIGFTKFGGKFVKDVNSEEELLVINDEDIICIFKENK